MDNDNKRYGLTGQYELDGDIESVVDGAFETAWDGAVEGLDTIADRMIWPLCVLVYKPMEMQDPLAYAHRLVEDLLGRLDEEYGDPDGEATKPTPAMIEAATAFAEVVMKNYVPWSCVPTGEVIEISRDEALKMLDEPPSSHAGNQGG